MLHCSVHYYEYINFARKIREASSMRIVLVLIIYFKVLLNIFVQSNMLEGDFHGDLRVITYSVPGHTNGFNILVLVI